MRQQFDRMRNLSNGSRRIFYIIIIAMIILGVIAFFTSELGRNITLICCGLIVLIVVVGILSERGMQKR